MLYPAHYRQPKFLILYASYGEGHIQAAKALKNAMEQFGNDRTVLFDLMAESHPWLNGVTRRFYQSSYTHMPHLYGWMYDFTKPMKHDSLFGSWLHSFGQHKIRQLLDQERPDAVIYTFPIYAMGSSRQGRSTRQIPSYAVITDFDLHRRWVHPVVDRYYVATEDLRSELRGIGIPKRKVRVSGIPLKQGFAAAEATPELYRKYGLSPSMRTVLIMAGAQGVMPNVAALCESLLEDPAIQLAVVCGRNEELRADLLMRVPGHDSCPRLHAYGFQHAIHELMSLADCLITKPGGITLAEAIAIGLPTFIYRPVPGQEKQNARYLASKGAAFVSYDASSMTDQLRALIHDPEKLGACRHNIMKLRAPLHEPMQFGEHYSTMTANAAESIILDIITNRGIMERISIF
jgi:processive 1,2-diacylglycerol beta-glucosyltransferase